MSKIIDRLIDERFQLDGTQEEHARLRQLRSDAAFDIAELLAALKKMAFISQSFIGHMTAEDLEEWNKARAVIRKTERK